ncbi:MAG TPA: hypothetical protein VGB63_16560 [Pedobacter sp.]|jgi:hypothetical protein
MNYFKKLNCKKTKLQTLKTRRYKLMLFHTIAAIILFGTACTDEPEFDYIVPLKSLKTEVPEPAPSLVLDQSNLTIAKPFYYNIVKSPMGQEFIPELRAIDVIELNIADASCSINDKSGGKLQIRIREAGITGKIIAVSDTISFASCFSGVKQFDLTSFVSVIPGSVYVIEPVYISGNTFLIYMDEGPSSNYKAGRFIINGNIEKGKDMWFKEGLYKSIARTKAQAEGDGWKKFVRNDGTVFNSYQDCINYVANP